MVSTMTDPEGWQLFDRLREMCFDVYVDGNFRTLGDRLGFVIATNRLDYGIAGYHEGRRETFARRYQRIYGTPLPKVPRETQSNCRGQT
jgi:hypothetical protein